MPDCTTTVDDVDELAQLAADLDAALATHNARIQAARTLRARIRKETKR